ncbi:MAG: polyprenyl synthetase family protein, partial [Chloroflexota bacterium]
LDFTSDQAKLGKPVASDLRQGLVTLPALLYLEMQPDDEDMLTLQKAGYVEEDRIDRLVNAIRESGAITSALNEAGKYIQRSLDALKGMPESKERKKLEEMASFVIDRHL